jgi:carbonic anhydrase
MGHTARGAVKGAIDNAELGNLTGLLAKIKPAVQATTYKGERSAKNYAFVDAVARKNIEITVADIRKDSPVLAELEAKGMIKITGAIYNLETGIVEFFGQFLKRRQGKRGTARQVSVGGLLAPGCARATA